MKVKPRAGHSFSMRNEITLALFLLALLGCDGSALQQVRPATSAEIFVFWPVDGRIHARVAGDTFADGPEFVEVRTQHGATTNARLIQGSYWATLPDELDAYIDVSPLDSDETIRADVPQPPLPPVEFVCCAARGTCQSVHRQASGSACPDPLTGIQTCVVDEDCAALEGVTIDVGAQDVVATAVGSDADVQLMSNLANVLVVLASSDARRAQLTDDVGFMPPLRVPSPTVGTVRVLDVDGFRSPEVDVTIP